MATLSFVALILFAAVATATAADATAAATPMLYEMVEEFATAASCKKVFGDDKPACLKVSLNEDAVVSEAVGAVRVPGGQVMERKEYEHNRGVGGLKATVFESEESLWSAEFSFHPEDGAVVSGVVNDGSGKAFEIAPCEDGSEKGCIILAEVPVNHNLLPDKVVGEQDNLDRAAMPRPKLLKLLNKGMRDTKTVARLSIMFYYTSQFARKVRDIDGFLEDRIAQANAAMTDSKVPIRFYAHCRKQIEVRDNTKTGQMFKEFVDYHGKRWDTLRHSADLAVLFADNIRDVCGTALQNSFDKPFGIVRADCSINGPAFPHELGHILGAQHDEKNGRNGWFPYGYGWYVRKTKRQQERRTIMAYPKPKTGSFPAAIGHFSSDSILFGGRKTGDARHNNAKVLTVTRFAHEATGDESVKCNAPGCVANYYSAATCNKFRKNGLCDRSLSVKQKCCKTCVKKG